MPPKAARGAGRGRGEARGRGRGRGRGGRAPAAPAVDASSTPREQEVDSQSTIVDSPMLDVDPAANTTLVHEQEHNDPNSSPATQPTETPAPTPVRPPPVTPNTNGATGSGSGTRGAGAAKPSKFKPKIVRAGAKEREEREARERERENARLSAAAAATAKESRVWGRGRGGRGRGDAMGRGRGVHTSGTASGPFAVAPAGGDKRGFFVGGSGVKREPGTSYSRSGGGRTSGSAFKTEIGGGAFAGGVLRGSYDPVAGRYMPEPQYPDEDDDAPRVDIENINLASDGDDDDDDDDVVLTGVGRFNKGRGKTLSNKGGLKPIRLDRKEHKDRVTIVNTESTVKSAPKDDNDSDAMIVDEGGSSRSVPQKRSWTGTYGDDVPIKTEPGTIPEMRYSLEPTPSSPPPSEFKVPGKVGDDLEFGMEITRPEPNSSGTEHRVKPRQALNGKERMPVIQTEEDRAEWERHVEDLDILRKELVGLAPHLDPQNKGKDVEGDIGMEQEDTPSQKEDGRIYLFQFPPVLPKLFNEITSSNPNDIKHDDDVEIMESLDLTKDKNAEVKSEEKVVEIKQEELDADEELKRKKGEALVVEEGSIGRLVVRESGKVELVWGGTNMKASRGVEASFYSGGAVVDSMDQWVKDEKGKDVPVMQGSRGMSLSMGMIMGKFVATPDWTSTH